MHDLVARLGERSRRFAIDQLQHSLQAATRAARAGAPAEIVFVALCHDVGKLWSWQEHARIGAALLRPYVCERSYRLLLAHDTFRARARWLAPARTESLHEDLRLCGGYEAAREFALEWDYPAFERSYASLPLEAFAPLFERFLTSPQREDG